MENPAVADSMADSGAESKIKTQAPRREDVEAAIAEAADKDALLLIDRYYADELRKLQLAVDKATSDSLGGFSDTVQQVVARFTEAPTNWHQAAVFALSTAEPGDAALRASGPRMFVMGVLMAVRQVHSAGVCYAVWHSTSSDGLPVVAARSVHGAAAAFHLDCLPALLHQ